MRTLIFAAAIWAALTQWVSAGCTLTLVGEFTVDTSHARAITTGQIDGKPIRIPIDTGTASSFMQSSAAQRLGLGLVSVQGVHVYGVGGEAKVQATTIHHLQIGTLYANDFTPFVVGGNGEQSADAPEFVLGDDLFSNFDTEFDLAHGKIRLFHAQGCKIEQVPYWTHTFSLADLEGWERRQPQIKSRVLVNGRPISAMLDTGAQLSTISKPAAERAGVTPWVAHSAPVGRATGIGGEQVSDWVGTFDTFSIGDETIGHVPLTIADMFGADKVAEVGSRLSRSIDNLPTMLVGIDFFMAHRMLVMPQQRKMVFTYNGGPVFRTKVDNPAK